MTNLTIRIETDNAAFDDDGLAEIQRILSEVVTRLGTGKKSGMLRDTNGNTVGDFTWAHNQESTR